MITGKEFATICLDRIFEKKERKKERKWIGRLRFLSQLERKPEFPTST